MWIQVFMGIWDLLKNPTVLVGIIGFIMCSWLWFGKVLVQRDVTKLKANVEVLEGNLKVAKDNNSTLVDTVKKLNDSQSNLKISIKALQKQVIDERNTTEKWIKYCSDKPVEVINVPSKPLIEKGVVTDDKSSKKYIDYVNRMLKSK